MDTPKLNPCIVCGLQPVFYSTGYGKDHWNVQCWAGKCQDVDSDNTEKIAAAEWNAANPKKDKS